MNWKALARITTTFVLVLIYSLLTIKSTPAQTCNFTGNWECESGNIRLLQTGVTVSGVFVPDGFIVGKANDNILQAVWWNGNKYNGADNGGQVIFRLSPDCNKLTGDWRWGDDKDNNKWFLNDWIATRMQESTPVNTTTPQLPPYNQSCNWQGNWDTSFGKMQVYQNELGEVEGTYNFLDGKIKGQISGNTLKGIWSQAPSYMPPDDAGEFQFTITPDCNSFKGNWRYGSNRNGYPWHNEDWNGSRL